MESSFKYWWLVLIKGIILILLSFYAFSYPVDALVGLALYIGIALMFAGVLLISTALALRKTDENWGWKLTEGIIDVIFAFVLLANPAVTAAVIPFVVGFWMMVYGVMIFADSFSIKKAGDSSWWMNLLGGILTVILGYLITSNIAAGALTISFWLGLGLLLVGIVNVAISFRLKKVNSVLKG